MRNYIKKALFIVRNISFVWTMLVGVFAFLAEILNPPTFENLLSKLHIPWTIEQFSLVATISVAISFILCLLLEKFFEE